MFDTQSAIDRKIRSRCPVIWCKHRMLDIRVVEWRAARKFDPLDRPLVLIADFNGPEGKRPAIGRLGYHGAEFQIMRAASIDASRKSLQPFDSRRITRLSGEVVTEIARWRQHHLCGALRTDSRPKDLVTQTALQKSDRAVEVIDKSPGSLKPSKTRGHRLRIEKLWVDEIRVLWSEVKRARDEVIRGHDVVHLAERIQRFHLRFVRRKGERAHLFLFEAVVDGL